MDCALLRSTERNVRGRRRAILFIVLCHASMTLAASCPISNIFNSSDEVTTGPSLLLMQDGTPAMIIEVKPAGSGIGLPQLRFYVALDEFGQNWSSYYRIIGQGQGSASAILLADGRLAVAYNSYPGDGVEFTVSADIYGAVWPSGHTVVTTGHSPSLILLNNGHPAVAFISYPHTLQFAASNDEFGSGWQFTTIVKDSYDDFYSLKLLGDGRPACSFVHTADFSLHVAIASSEVGTGPWSAVLISTIQPYVLTHDLLIMNNGRPAVAFLASVDDTIPTASVYFTVSVDDNASQWQESSVYSPQISLSVPTTLASIMLGDGRPVIMYFGYDQEDQKSGWHLSVCSDVRGEQWRKENSHWVDTYGGSGLKMLLLSSRRLLMAHVGQFKLSVRVSQDTGASLWQDACASDVLPTTALASLLTTSNGPKFATVPQPDTPAGTVVGLLFVIVLLLLLVLFAFLYRRRQRQQRARPPSNNPPHSPPRSPRSIRESSSSHSRRSRHLSHSSSAHRRLRGTGPYGNVPNLGVSQGYVELTLKDARVSTSSTLSSFPIDNRPLNTLNVAEKSSFFKPAMYGETSLVGVQQLPSSVSNVSSGYNPAMYGETSLVAGDRRFVRVSNVSNDTKAADGAAAAKAGGGDESDDEAGAEQYDDVEQDEDALYRVRAKIYRFDLEGKQWKERGVGQLRILEHKETKKRRVLMRREKVHKVCANHYMIPGMRLEPMSNNKKAWVYSCPADFADNEAKKELFAVRFASEEDAQEFKTHFEKGVDHNGALKGGTPKKDE